MRQVLPTKPLARATRYGPGLAGHWKYLVLASQGLKQPGFSPGPATTAGPAARAWVETTHAATAAPMPMRMLIAVSLGGAEYNSRLPTHRLWQAGGNHHTITRIEAT